MECLLVRKRTLVWELALFFLCGGISCLCGGIAHFIPILQAQPPYGAANDDVWRFVALGGVVVFLAVKSKLVMTLRDREIQRIQVLRANQRQVWQCYKISRVVFLAILITCFKVIETHTEDSYASRLIFTVSCVRGLPPRSPASVLTS